MDWDRIAGNWEYYKGNARRHWAKLTEAEVERIAGMRECLAAKIQQAYGLSSEQAELRLASWQEAQRERKSRLV